MDKRLNVGLALVLCLGWAGISRGVDGAKEWAQWRGPKRDSISTETGLLKKWPDGGPRLIWTATGLGDGFSTVAIANGTIYTAGVLDKTTHVMALDMDGKLKWKSPNGDAWSAPSWARRRSGNDSGHSGRRRGGRGGGMPRFVGARAAPTIDDGVAYHLAELGRLAAFDATTGKEKWAFSLPEKFAAERPKWGMAEAPLIDGDNLIYYAGGAKGYMVALNKKTGDVVWANTDIGDQASYCSAILVEFGGVRQIITMSAKAVIGVNADSGAKLWRVGHVNMRSINISTPVFHDGYVLASNGYGGGSIIIKLKAEGGKISAEKVWSGREMDNHHGGVVLLDGYVYGSGDRDKGWSCIELKTGKVLYKAAGVGKGSVTYADGMLYCYGEDGLMGLVAATPKEHVVTSQFQVPKGGEGKYWAHPVIFDGRLYLRHADKLYAYDIKAR